MTQRETLIIVAALVVLWLLTRSRSSPLVSARIGGADVAPGVDVGLIPPFDDESWIE